MGLAKPFILATLTVGALTLASCSFTGDKQSNKDGDKLSDRWGGNVNAAIADAPTGLMGSTPGQQKAKQLTASSQDEMLKMDSGAVYFTDAHNPDALIEGLDEAFEQRTENRKWIQSYAQALREAQRTEKPILIWFHHSKGSPPSRKLSEELFHTTAFEEWAKENVIRVCYDQAEDFENEPNAAKRKKMKEYVAAAPAHFGVRGSPVVLILSPSGDKANTLRGYYTGQASLYMDRIKNAIKIAEQQYAGYKKSMEAKGYRTWTGQNGRTLFAKLSRYVEDKGIVWLKECDGHQTKTPLSRLSQEDQNRILDEKKRYDERKKRR